MIKNLIERDRKVIADIEKIRFFPVAPIGGKGCYIINQDGRHLLDFAGSWGAAGLGYSHPEITNAISIASKNMASSSLLSYASEPAILLAEELISIVPGDTPRKVWFGHSGSDANDTIVRLVQAATGRKNFITFHGAYHGGVTGSMSVSGHSSQQHNKRKDEVFYLPYPNPYRPQYDGDLGEEVLKELDQLFISSCPPEKVAAIFIEPIQSDGGVIVPPKGFLKALEKKCKKHNILIVVDEVKVGLGRSGLMNAFEYENLEPDIVCFGKALGGGLPLSAVVGPQKLMDFAPAFSIMTASGNPVSISAGRAVLSTIKKDNLIDNAKKIGELLQNGFKQLSNKHELIGDIRGRGLAIGVEIVKDKFSKREEAKIETAKIVYRAYQLGLIIFYVGMKSNVLELTPPLILNEKQANEGLEILDQAFLDVSKGKVSDEILNEFQGW